MAGKEAVPIADETMEVEDDHHHHDASGKEEALGAEASMEVGGANNESGDAMVDSRKHLKRKRPSDDAFCTTDGAGKIVVEGASSTSAAEELATTEKQVADLIGTVGSHVGAATAEIARLQREVSKKTGEVSALSLRLKSALGDVTKLKKEQNSLPEDGGPILENELVHH